MSEGTVSKGTVGKGPRIVVVQAEGPRGLEASRPAVGVVPFWFERGLHLGIVCKLALETVGDEVDSPPFSAPARLATAALSLDRASRFATDGPTELDYASDFVPRKPAVDITLVGHAGRRDGAQEVPIGLRVVRADGEVVIDRKVAVVRAGAPLAAPHVGPVERPGPRRVTFREDPSEEMTSFEACASGGPALRAPRGTVSSDARLEIAGAGPGGAACVDLPGLAVVATVDVFDGELEVPMAIDTLWVDLDTGRVEIVYRGDARLPAGDLAFVERVVVSLERLDGPRSPRWRLADTQRGTIGWAATEEDGGKAPATAPDHPLLVAARYRTWASAAPEPRVPLPTYTRVAAELAERPSARGEVLTLHGFTEDRWFIEERAWLERIAQDSLGGDHALAATYGALFDEAQAALAAPDEATVTLRRYAEVRVALERSMDPMEALDGARWSLPRFARIERRWLAAADAEPAVARELDGLLEELAVDAEETA